MFKLEFNPLGQVLHAALVAAVLAIAMPAAAFHFPWDQGHDTTRSNDPNNPGPDDRPPCDPCNPNATKSPAYASLGHAIWSNTDVVLRGRPYLGVYRAYNSNDPVVGLFGNGWTVDFDIALYPATSSGVQQRIFKAANGKRFVYVKQTDGSYKAPDSRFETIAEGATSVTMTMLDGRRNVFALDGRLLQRIDTNGNAVNFSYDAALRPIRIDDGNGRSLSITYNGTSFVAGVADHTGRTWAYAYDANGNLTSVTDPLGGVLRYTWQAYRPSGDANTYWQLLTVTDAANVRQVGFAYTGDQVASYTEGANTFTYTRTAGNTKLAGTVTKRDSTGASTSFTYGALGLVTQDVDGIGGRTSYTYDTNGRITATIDALNRTWASAYDTLGRMTSSTNPLAQTSAVAYAGSDPRPVSMTSPSGRVVGMSYDARGNLLATTDPAGAITRMAYNARGDVTSITNALGQATSIVYSATGLPTQVTDSLGRSGTTTYDALGRVLAATNAAGETSRYAYDALDRVTSVTDPLGQVTSFTYDPAGRLTSVTDAKGSVTQYQYDTFGRRSAEVAPDGRRTSYAYRADNLLQTITWPDNTTISYNYDANKRVTSETAGTEVISYSYNAVNQLLSSSGPGGTVSYTYDNAGRVATETTGGRTNTITRNAEGERIGISYLGQTLSYTRDARGLVTQIASPAGNFGFAFDALGRRTQLSYPNGSTASYAFDAAGQLTNLTHAGVFNAPYAHSFDAAGRITRITGDGPDWNYTYDALGRLTRATQGTSNYTYTLDPVGNILDGGRTHDANHRLTGDTAKTYAYDQRGNLTLEQDCTTGARTAYTWNVKNQLTQVQFFADAATPTPTRTLAYTYDPLGRRASKTDNGTVQRFVYDGDDLVGTLDATNNPTATNVFSGAIDEPLASTTGGSAKTLYANHLGSIMAVADGATLTNSYRYSPYGDTVAPSGADSVPFRYTGREKDTESLYYYRARYYSAAMGRFLSLDPIGQADGPNQYEYASGDPISFNDPNGEWANLVIGAISGAATGYLLAKLTGDECYGWDDALQDAALGAVGAGLASKANKLYRVAKLRSIAGSRGLQNAGKKGYVETWKGGTNALEKLEIKFEAGKSANLQAGSKVPRFSYRTDAGTYWDPFTGRTGPKGALSHVPLEPTIPGRAAAAGAVGGAVSPCSCD